MKNCLRVTRFDGGVMVRGIGKVLARVLAVQRDRGENLTIDSLRESLVGVRASSFRSKRNVWTTPLQ